MRIVEIVGRQFGRSWKSSLRRLGMRLHARWVRDEHIRPGHTYRDHITGEYLTVESVGPQVSIRRHDAEGDDAWSTPKRDVQLALDAGLLVHAKQRCRSCPSGHV